MINTKSETLNSKQIQSYKPKTQDIMFIEFEFRVFEFV